MSPFEGIGSHKIYEPKKEASTRAHMSLMERFEPADLQLLDAAIFSPEGAHMANLVMSDAPPELIASFEAYLKEEDWTEKQKLEDKARKALSKFLHG